MTRRALVGLVGAFVVLGWLPAAAVAGPRTCGSDYYGSVWVARTPGDWPDGWLYRPEVIPPGVTPPATFGVVGDGRWYDHGGTKKNSISAVISASGCGLYPKYDFTFNLYYSTRELTANVPGHVLDPYFVNIDRMASVPVTVDGTAFRTFCSGETTTASLVLDEPHVKGDGSDYPYPVRSTDGSVLLDNYAGCGVDGAWMYYVRRGMVIQSNDLDQGVLGVMLFNHSTHGLTPVPCDQDACTGTSYARVYHPDPYSWVIVPEIANGDWTAAYALNTVDGTATWAFHDYLSVPLMILVKRPQ